MLLILGPNKKFKERKSFADPRIIDHEGNDTILGFSFRLSSQSNPDSFENSHLRHVLLIIFHNHKWNAQSCKITITACEVENFVINNRYFRRICLAQLRVDTNSTIDICSITTLRDNFELVSGYLSIMVKIPIIEFFSQLL